MGIYAADIEKMEAQLNLWSAQIKLLEAKIESASSIIKLERAREVNDLRRKHRLAVEKLQEMKTATNKAWDQVKGAADKIWDDLKTGLANAHVDAT
jgi:multidrug resistance efflux pump